MILASTIGFIQTIECFHAQDQQNALHIWPWLPHFENLWQVNVRSNTGSSQSEHATWLHDIIIISGEQDNMASVMATDLLSFDFKIFLGYRHPIIKLTIWCQSRMDTESCHLFFCLKLLIFDGAKWVQMYQEKNNRNTQNVE